MNPLKHILSQIITYKTVTNEPTDTLSALDWIDQELSNSGLTTRRLVSDGFPMIIAASKSFKRPKVLLQAHLDVVPGNPDQFTLREQDGRYYGRGTFDMKFAIACFMHLADELKNHDDLDYGIMITTDEEIGGYNGVKYLMDQGYRADVCLLPDGGDNWHIDTASRGVWHLTLRVEGDGAHGSRPWEGNNALIHLLEAARSIESAFANQPDDSVSVALTTFHSGQAINQIPDVAECSFDIRYRSHSDYIFVKRVVDNVCKEYGIEQNNIIRDPAFELPPNNGYLKAFSQLVQKHAGHIPTQRESFGSSDARFMAASDIPVIISRPIGGDPHGEDEWIDSKSLEQFYAVVRDFVLLFATTEKYAQNSGALRYIDRKS